MARARWMRIRTFGSLEKVPAPVAGENIRALGTALAPRRTAGNMLAKNTANQK